MKRCGMSLLGFRWAVGGLLLGAIACGSETSGPEDAVDSAVQARPYGLTVPSAYQGQPMTLVVALHGLGGDGPSYAGPGGRTGLHELAEANGFLLAYPSSLNYELSLIGLDLAAWNGSLDGALDPLASFLSVGLADDLAYLKALITHAKRRFSVKRVVVQGASNGGFLAHAFACAFADEVAAVASFAGTLFEGEDLLCTPSQAVAVMHTHGTADTVVPYAGGPITFGVPLSVSSVSSQTLVDTWRVRNGCSDPGQTSTFDAVDALAGSETSVTVYDACSARVEAWVVNGAGHEPDFNQAYRQALVNFIAP